MIKRIVVHRPNLRDNQMARTSSKPVIIVKHFEHEDDRDPVYEEIGHSAHILGESFMVYDYERPLEPEGSQIWVETQAEVNLFSKT